MTWLSYSTALLLAHLTQIWRPYACRVARRELCVKGRSTKETALACTSGRMTVRAARRMYSARVAFRNLQAPAKPRLLLVFPPTSKQQT